VSAPEQVVVDLPLSVDAVVAIANGLHAVCPKAHVVPHPSKLIIELSGPKVEDEG
jgi:hypothetical protein